MADLNKGYLAYMDYLEIEDEEDFIDALFLPGDQIDMLNNLDELEHPE